MNVEILHAQADAVDITGVTLTGDTFELQAFIETIQRAMSSGEGEGQMLCNDGVLPVRVVREIE